MVDVSYQMRHNYVFQSAKVWTEIMGGVRKEAITLFDGSKEHSLISQNFAGKFELTPGGATTIYRVSVSVRTEETNNIYDDD